MRLLLLIASCVAVSTAASSTINEWLSFKAHYGKQYKNVGEENFRLGVYMTNKEMVEKHNERYRQGLETYELKINRFADQLQDEVSALMNGLNATYLKPSLLRTQMLYSNLDDEELPESVDWREKGAVTPVKNQGGCGSCWAFSSTGSLEGQLFLKTGKLVSLSEQNLVDCSSSYGNNGCRGGLMNQAFAYIKENGGINDGSSYPYEGIESYCRYRESRVAGTASGYISIPAEDEEALKSAVANVGPISVAINAGIQSFTFYRGGVYNDARCSQTLNHGVLLVGYGTENGQDYWLVKNSWGPMWGDNGYVKIARNEGNLCGIASLAGYPAV